MTAGARVARGLTSGSCSCGENLLRASFAFARGYALRFATVGVMYYVEF